MINHIKKHKKFYLVYMKLVIKIKLIVSKFKKFKNKKSNSFFNHRPYQFNGANYKELWKSFMELNIVILMIESL